MGSSASESMLSGCAVADATAADMDVRLQGSWPSAMLCSWEPAGQWEEAAELRTSRGGQLAAGGIFRGKFRRSDESSGAGPQESAPEGPPRVEATRQVGPSAGKVPWKEQHCRAEVLVEESGHKSSLRLGGDVFETPCLEFLHAPT